MRIDSLVDIGSSAANGNVAKASMDAAPSGAPPTTTDALLDELTREIQNTDALATATEDYSQNLDSKTPAVDASISGRFAESKLGKFRDTPARMKLDPTTVVCTSWP